MNPELIFFIIVLFLLSFYLFFLTQVLSGLKRIINDQNHVKEIKYFNISVIIPFRNEKENILKNLKCIEKQNYPENAFEVIYVNDFSSDGSAELLSAAISRSNIKIIEAGNDRLEAGFKKAAVKKGIMASSGEIIITTDADTVFGNNWLQSMVKNFKEETGLVSGPVNFFYGSSIFSAFEVLEFAGLVLTGAGLIGINNPVICNGANLAYLRKAFDQVGGFADQLHLSSGEDELLMQSISRNTSFKINFSWNRESLVTTSPPAGWRGFLEQRRRWASKSFHYQDKSLKFKLFLIFLFYLGIPVQLIFSFLFSKLFLLMLALTLTAKIIPEFFIIRKGSDFLFSKKIMKLFFIAEFLQIPYIIYSSAAGVFGNFKWKERKLRR